MIDLFRERGPFTVAEVASACRVSVRFVHGRIKSRRLRACQVGRVLRIPASAARAFAQKLGVEPSPKDLSDEVREMRDMREVREMRMDTAPPGAQIPSI